MAKKRKYWSEVEAAFLRNHYLNGKGVEWIAEKLGMSKTTVYSKAKYMNLPRRRMPAYNRVHFSKSEEKFIRKNFNSMTNPQLAAALGKTLTVLRNKCREMGLLHMQLEYWTKEQVDYLIANFKIKGDVELAEYYNSVKAWKKNKGWTKKHIEKKRRYLNLKRTSSEQLAIKNRNIAQGRFSISHWKRWENLEAPIGDIRVWANAKGALFKVIKTEKGFVHLAPHIYRIHHGKIKKGNLIRFKDRNPLNCDPENLEQISRSQMAKLTVSKHSKEKSDQYLAGIMARGDKEYQKQLLRHPELLELKRIQLLSNQKINQLNESTQKT